jgi:hypothetical protein
MSTPDYHLGDKAKATIGTVAIKGLNALKIPGMTRETVTVKEFNRDQDFEVPTSASWERGSLSGNYVQGDTTGQTVLRAKLLANEGLADLRLYENEDDFWAADLATDENSQFYVMSNPGPEIEKSGLIPFSAEILLQGSQALFDAHSETVTNFEAQAINGTGFDAAGFEIGDTIIIDASTSNDTITDLVVTNVSATVITVTGGPMTVEAGTDSIVHGGSF